MNSQIKDPIRISLWDGKKIILPKKNLKDIPFFTKYWSKNANVSSFQLLYPYSEFRYFLKYLKDNVWVELHPNLQHNKIHLDLELK